MLKDLFSNRLFIGALAFFVLCVGGSLLYMQHVEQPSAREMAAHEERLKQLTDRKTQQPTKAVSSVASQTEQGHFHADDTFHAEPHERIAAPSEVSDPEVSRETTALQMEYNRGAGNPPPFDKVPVDLWDFEATKAAMTENLNFFMANWHPFEYNREVSIANATIENIDNAARATQLGLYTPEQAAEIHAMYLRYYKFKGHNPGRVHELKEQGYTRKEAIRIAAEETLQRQKQQWGVK